MTTTIFDYWLADNQLHYNWVLNRLRVEGADGHIDGEVVTFTATSESPTELAAFLDGRTYNYLNWIEVGASLDEPAPEEVVAPKRKGGKKKVDPVTPTPEPVVVTPEPTPVEPTPEPTPVVEPVEPAVQPVDPTPEPTPVVPTPDAPKTIMDFDANKDGKLEPDEIKAYTDYVAHKKS
jgi:hypothetical protein